MIVLLACILILIQFSIAFHFAPGSVLTNSKLWGVRQFTYGTYGTFADVETRKDREVTKFHERLGIGEDALKMDTIKDHKTGRELRKDAHKHKRLGEKPPKVKLPPIESTFNSSRNYTAIAIIVECLNGCYNGMHRSWLKTTENGRMAYFEWEKFFSLVGDRIARLDEIRKRKKLYSWIKYSLNKRHIWVTKEGVWEWQYKPYRKSKAKTAKAAEKEYTRKRKKRVITGFI